MFYLLTEFQNLFYASCKLLTKEYSVNHANFQIIFSNFNWINLVLLRTFSLHFNGMGGEFTILSFSSEMQINFVKCCVCICQNKESDLRNASKRKFRVRKCFVCNCRKQWKSNRCNGIVQSHNELFSKEKQFTIEMRYFFPHTKWN